MRKAFFALLAAAIVALAPAVPAQAKWPEKPIRLVLPFGPGGVADVTARILAPSSAINSASRWWSRTCLARAASTPRAR